MTNEKILKLRNRFSIGYGIAFLLVGAEMSYDLRNQYSHAVPPAIWLATCTVVPIMAWLARLAAKPLMSHPRTLSFVAPILLNLIAALIASALYELFIPWVWDGEFAYERN
jgi:hypothetical protein